MNDHLVLICGKATMGKSASLCNLESPEKKLYLNCEAGKHLPFRSKFETHVITDPYQIYEGFNYAAGEGADIDTIIVDSVTFLMDMFESVHVLPSSDTQAAWQHYQQYFKNLMQQYVAGSKQSCIFTAHVEDIYNDKTLNYESRVPVKGALRRLTIESFFSCIVNATRMALTDLEGYENDLLTISEDDEILGYKHVFQTRPTKETVGTNIRSPMGMFSRNETYIDNDAQLLLNRLKEFYV